MGTPREKMAKVDGRQQSYEDMVSRDEAIQLFHSLCRVMEYMWRCRGGLSLSIQYIGLLYSISI